MKALAVKEAVKEAVKAQFYSLYVSERAVELRFNYDHEIGKGRLICSQKNYESILEFGLKLASHKGLPFLNLASPAWVDMGQG
jgi:hypothetical protein